MFWFEREDRSKKRKLSKNGILIIKSPILYISYQKITNANICVYILVNIDFKNKKNALGSDMIFKESTKFEVILSFFSPAFEVSWNFLKIFT